MVDFNIQKFLSQVGCADLASGAWSKGIAFKTITAALGGKFFVKKLHTSKFQEILRFLHQQGILVADIYSSNPLIPDFSSSPGIEGWVKIKLASKDEAKKIQGNSNKKVLILIQRLELTLGELKAALKENSIIDIDVKSLNKVLASEQEASLIEEEESDDFSDDLSIDNLIEFSSKNHNDGSNERDLGGLNF